MKLFASTRFGEHVTPPGHPERMERAGVFDAVAGAFRSRGGVVSDPRPATREELARIHTGAYLDQVAAADGRAVMLDPDTFTSPESVEIAGLAAGAAIEAACHAWTTGESAMALVRPPGHHAEPDRAMGFCLYNNIAVAAAALRAEGASRVAIVDFDVHHGNGTQAAFYADPSVLFISSHQFPYYPGTGAADETGTGAGRGFTVNVPMQAGARDAEYDRLYRSIVLPALSRAVWSRRAAGVGRLRRARARSARGHANDDGGVRRPRRPPQGRGVAIVRRPNRVRHRGRIPPRRPPRVSPEATIE